MDINYKLMEKEFEKSKLLKFSGGAFEPPCLGLGMIVSGATEMRKRE